jgi:hypothetical protein
MRNRKATGDNDVLGDVLKLLGEGGLEIMTKLINTLYETGEWPKDFTEVTIIALMKNTRATKCSEYRPISLIAHREKIIENILSKKDCEENLGCIGEDKFGFRREKDTRDSFEMMRIIAVCHQFC